MRFEPNLLITFLKENRLYSKFCKIYEGLDSLYGHQPNHNIKTYLQKRKMDPVAIISAFRWDLNGGYNYWMTISEKWKRYLEVRACGKNLFEEFLKKYPYCLNGSLYKVFKSNLSATGRDVHLYIAANSNAASAIFWAFTWASTLEGADYWQAVSQAWVKYLDEFEQFLALNKIKIVDIKKGSKIPSYYLSAFENFLNPKEKERKVTKKMESKYSKQLLCTGNIVLTQGGSRLMVVKTGASAGYLTDLNGLHQDLISFNADLTHTNKSWTIMKVYNPKSSISPLAAKSEPERPMFVREVLTIVSINGINYKVDAKTAETILNLCKQS